MKAVSRGGDAGADVGAGAGADVDFDVDGANAPVSVSGSDCMLTLRVAFSIKTNI